jgi:hypothetical protein
MKDYEKEYEEFWKEIVENPDGSINMDQLKKELSDFRLLIHNAQEVYMHITGGVISKVLTNPEAVIRIADEYYENLYEDDTFGPLID